MNDKKFDIIFVGHFAIDTIIYENEESHSLGGGVTYGPLAAYNYDPSLKIGICSEVGHDFDKNLLNIFNNTTIDLEGIKFDSEFSTNYRLYYHDSKRELTLKYRAKPIDFRKIPEKYKNAKCFMLAPIANEITDDFLEKIIKYTNGYIAADVQGFIRRFNKDGTLNLSINKEIAKKMRNFIHNCGEKLILKASDEEAKYIAECDDVIESTKSLAENTNAIILTTLGRDGSLIKFKNYKMIHIPAFQPNQILDETGAGDCYIAVFLSEFLNSNHTWEEIKKAGYMASVACSFLLEKKGPHGYVSKSKILKRLEEKNIIESKFHKIIKENYF
ncbi:MAG: PfkB family carbohydrate kinase [Promethearchaeota archaeon]